MAILISAGSGNWTTAATWKAASSVAAAILESQINFTTLTTSPVASAAFTLTATAVDAILVKLSSRVASPSGTITVELYNATTAAVVRSLTINVSDLPACGTATGSPGGWITFVFSAGSYTPNGTDSFTVRAYTSASTQVGLYRNNTAGNWSRLVRTTTTGTPAAGDRMVVVGAWTAAATLTSYTVTMNETATTDYGTSSTTQGTDPALSISKGGTLTWDTASNTWLKLSGHMEVYSEGVLNMGVPSGTAIPRANTSTLEFDCVTNGDFGLYVQHLATWRFSGQSRTSSNNTFRTKLTADVAASGTGLTTAATTGWKSGDEVAIASTTRTPTQAESRALSGDASGTSITLASGVTNAHSGSSANQTQADVLLLTRNLVIKGTSDTVQSFIIVSGTATVEGAWTRLKWMSGTAATRKGLTFLGFAGTASLEYCVSTDGRGGGFLVETAFTGTLSITHCGAYRINLASGSAGFDFSQTSHSGTITFTDNISMATYHGLYFLNWNLARFNVTDFIGTSCTSRGWYGVASSAAVDISGFTYDNIEVYANGDNGIEFTYLMRGGLFSDIKSWRNAGFGLRFLQTMMTVTFMDVLLFGNTTTNFVPGMPCAAGIKFIRLNCYSDTAFNVTSAIAVSSATGRTGIRFIDCNFGASVAGVFAPHITTIDMGAVGTLRCYDWVFDNCLFADVNLIDGLNEFESCESTIAFQGFNGVSGDDRTYGFCGLVRRQTVIADSGAAIMMQPRVTTDKLDTAACKRGSGFLVAASEGQEVQVDVKVLTDGAYNGASPRLILKANSLLGFDEDVVLDTHSGSDNVFDDLTGTTDPVTGDGVLEFVVDCDGSVGTVVVDTFVGAAA